MDLAFLLQAVFLSVVLLCPLSILGMLAWSAWSSRRADQKDGRGAAPVQSAADEADIQRMRAQLDEPDAEALSRR